MFSNILSSVGSLAYNAATGAGSLACSVAKGAGNIAYNSCTTALSAVRQSISSEYLQKGVEASKESASYSASAASNQASAVASFAKAGVLLGQSLYSILSTMKNAVVLVPSYTAGATAGIECLKMGLPASGVLVTALNAIESGILKATILSLTHPLLTVSVLTVACCAMNYSSISEGLKSLGGGLESEVSALSDLVKAAISTAEATGYTALGTALKVLQSTDKLLLGEQISKENFEHVAENLSELLTQDQEELNKLKEEVESKFDTLKSLNADKNALKNESLLNKTAIIKAVEEDIAAKVLEAAEASGGLTELQSDLKEKQSMLGDWVNLQKEIFDDFAQEFADSEQDVTVLGNS